MPEGVWSLMSKYRRILHPSQITDITLLNLSHLLWSNVKIPSFCLPASCTWSKASWIILTRLIFNKIGLCENAIFFSRNIKTTAINITCVCYMNFEPNVSRTISLIGSIFRLQSKPIIWLLLLQSISQGLILPLAFPIIQSQAKWTLSKWSCRR